MTPSHWLDEFANQRVTPFEMRVLVIIAAAGPLTSAEVARTHGGSDARIRKAIESLEAADLLRCAERGYILTIDWPYF